MVWIFFTVHIFSLKSCRFKYQPRINDQKAKKTHNYIQKPN